MKENFKLEELFKQKFDNFQPDVDPSVWANIQAGMGAGATGAVAGGISAAVKIGLISGGIIAASVATWYFGFYEPADNKQVLNQQQVIEGPVQNGIEDTAEPVILVQDQNNQVTPENQQQLENELHNHNVNQQGTTNNTNSTATGNNSSVSNNGGSGNTSNNTVTNPVNTNQQTANNNSGNTTDADDKQKEQLPTGRMEFTQSSLYAPSAVSFVSNARNFEEVHWDFGDGTVAEGTEAKHTYAKPGKYEVRMSVVGEKHTYDESQELVIKSKSSIDNVPNIITPNGDRINDFFSVKTTDIETFYITITDNRGNEVFTSNDKDFAWDGTDYSGQTVEKGIYTYVIIAEGKDGSVIKLPGQIYVQ